MIDKNIRILIVGDSWAKTIRRGGISGKDKKNPFKKALKRYGFVDIETQGENTVWSGIKTSELNNLSNLQIIKNELETHNNIDIIHLISGGNDYLFEAITNNLLNKKDSEITLFFEKIALETITFFNNIKKIRKNIILLVVGYDYVDVVKAGTIFNFNTSGFTNELFNFWFNKMSDILESSISKHKNIFYINNMGLFYKSSTLTNTEIDIYKKSIPLEYFKDDGIHPNNSGNALILNNCFDKFYKTKL